MKVRKGGPNLERKSYSQEFKNKLVEEAQATGNATIVARKYGVAKSSLSKWISAYKTNAKKSYTDNTVNKYPEIKDDPEELKAALKQNEQMKRLLGERELEIAVLRDLLKKTTIPLPTRC